MTAIFLKYIDTCIIQLRRIKVCINTSGWASSPHKRQGKTAAVKRIICVRSSLDAFLKQNGRLSSQLICGLSADNHLFITILKYSATRPFSKMPFRILGASGGAAWEWQWVDCSEGPVRGAGRREAGWERDGATRGLAAGGGGGGGVKKREKFTVARLIFKPARVLCQMH